MASYSYLKVFSGVFVLSKVFPRKLSKSPAELVKSLEIWEILGKSLENWLDTCIVRPISLLNSHRIDVTSENFRCSDDFRSFFPMNTFGTLRLIP